MNKITNNNYLVKLEIYNKKFDKFIKEIDSNCNYYSNNIELSNNNIQQLIKKYDHNLSKFNDRFSFFSEKEIQNILKQLEYLSNINILENSKKINLNDEIENHWFNSKELLEYFINKYDKIIFENLNKLIDENPEYENIIFLLLNLFNFENYSIDILELNHIRSLIYILDIDTNNLESIRNVYIDKNIEYDIKNIYDKINYNKNSNKFNIDESQDNKKIDLFFNYKNDFKESNESLIDEKKNLENILDKYLNQIVNLDFLKINISVQDIIQDKKKYINLLSKKEEYIKNSISDYNDFNNLFQNYKYLENFINKKNDYIQKLESELTELQIYIGNNNEEKINNDFIIKKKKLRINLLTKTDIKNYINTNEKDLLEYNNNLQFLDKQKDLLNKYLLDIEKIKKKVIEINKDIVSYKLKIDENHNNIIIKNRFNQKINTKELELKNLEEEITNLNYELLFVKKNIKIADKKHSKFFVKKIISENLLYKINKYNNLHNNNQVKVNNDFKKEKEILYDEYQNNLDNLKKNRILFENLSEEINKEINDYNKAIKKFKEYQSIIKNKYDEYFKIKNSIVKTFDILIKIEDIYKKYDLIINKLNNNNSILFLKKYILSYEKKFIDNFKKINIEGENKHKILIDLYSKIMNFYNYNIYYLYHIFRFNTIVKLDLNNLSFFSLFSKIQEINSSNFVKYNNNLNNLIKKNNSLINENKNKELEKFIDKISSDMKNINKFNTIKNNLVKMKIRLMKSDLNKISRY